VTLCLNRFLSALIFFVLGLSVFAYSDSTNTAYTCLDTLKIRDMYHDGHIREVYHMWDNFGEERAGLGKIPLSPDCVRLFNQYMGVLKLVLNHDTLASQIHFSQLLNQYPESELWEFDLTLGPQNFWDHFKETNVKHVHFFDSWKSNWLPPLRFETVTSPDLLQLRKTYHLNRRLFAVAEGNPLKFYEILKNTEGISDPAIFLLRESAKFKLEVDPHHLIGELDNLYLEKSKLITDDNVDMWCLGLTALIQLRQFSIRRQKLQNQNPEKLNNAKLIITPKKNE